MPKLTVAAYEKNIAELESKMNDFNVYADTKDSIDVLLDKLSVTNLTKTKPFESKSISLKIKIFLRFHYTCYFESTEFKKRNFRP